MKRVAALLAVLALTACAGQAREAAPTADPVTARAIPQGQLLGYVDSETGAHVWRSIPFAAPPVGDLRWRAPRPPKAWTGQRLSTGPAPWCPQQLSALDGVDKSRFGDIVGQEDCLYLNIYAPPMSAAQAAGARLPVMMWIHGGSNTWGRAEQYDGAALAARFKVVVVVIQYRLGALGWMANPALREGGTLPEDASANFGTLDQIRALEWIRDDVAAFGGDAGRVTIFGESAGGQNVAALLSSPRAAGLFHRAIVQSGSFQSVPLAVAEGREGLKPEAGGPVGERIAGFGQSVTGSTLRAAPLKAVFAAYELSEGEQTDPLRIIADGVVLPENGISSVLGQSTSYNAVPVITGTNQDEMKLFNALNPKLVRWVLGKLPMPRSGAYYAAVARYPSRMWRVNAVDKPAAAMTAGGNAAVWTYRFDWDEEGRFLVTDLGKLLGSGHSLEIPFVFGHFKLLGSFDRFAFTKRNAPGRVALSDAMMSYWANFAATGAPGRGVDGRLPEWKPWSSAPAADRIMLFDSPGSGGVRMSSDLESGQRIVADLMSDQKVRKQKQRCEILARLTQDNPELNALAVDKCPGPSFARRH